MLLELAKLASFLLSILSLYSVLVPAFFEPARSWQQRLVLGLTRLAVAGCISVASGCLFALPVRTNPDRHVPLWKTLPIRVFLSAAIVLATLFLLTWYLRCGGANSLGVERDCS